MCSSISPILPPMTSILGTALKKSTAVVDAVTGGPRWAPDYAYPVTAPFVLAIGTASFTAYLATETGRAILGELRRRRRLREKRPDSPSLRGAPTPEELEADAALSPRTLAIRLRMGSRLADLEPTLDAGIAHKTLPNGQKRIRSRGPGLKGWLADRRVTVNYSTLVRYKKLVQRLRQLLALDDRLPLEWLLPGAVPSHPVPPDLQTQYQTARRRLARLLRDHWNFSRLQRYVEDKLGIPRLLSVRRAPAPAPDRWGGKPRRAARPVRRPPPQPARVEATKRELLRFLREPSLAPPLAHLRNKVLHWLRTLPPNNR